jgi:hypothetical protein
MPSKKRSGFFNDTRAYSYDNMSVKHNPNTTDSVCQNGYPVSQYHNLNPVEALYSIWNSYQSMPIANFSTIQKSVLAPNNLTNPPSGPANIFIIRHGEKNWINYGLDKNGIYRACQLANFINTLEKSSYPISYILSNQPDAYNTNTSMHPAQTVSCASFLLNIPHIMYSNASDVDTTVKALYETGIYDGLNVLICWNHQHIQKLCLELLNTGAAQSISRITQNNANDFFKETNACPDGNYVTTDPTSLFYPPQQPQLHDNYKDSQYYPYWNNNNFNSIYCFYSNQTNGYKFTFEIKSIPINTCYTSCNLNIGLYQAIGTTYYENYNTDNDIESNCEVPSEWSV